MKKRYIVFDFDGTIADTITPGMKLANNVLKDMGETVLTDEQLKSLGGKSYIEIIKTFNVPIWKIPSMLLKMRMVLQDNFKLIKPYAHMQDTLKQLAKEGYYLYILTSNDKVFVQKFLDAFEISVFEDIYSELNIFGKAQALKKFMRLQNITNTDMIYIGDEVRDIEACKKNNVEVISVTWGFNTKEKLQEYKPNAIVSTPKDLIHTIEKLSK